jgi:predicted alpha/beta-hydrolase family hydrolase
MLWLEDGDHDLRPRRAVTGLTQADHLRTMAAAAASWAARL